MSVSPLHSFVRMADDEIPEFLAGPHHLTVCTANHDGTIHAVAMYYGFIGEHLAFQTKVKSQKIQNLRRDYRLTCMVRQGLEGDEIRGVQIVGRGEIVEDEQTVEHLIAAVRSRYTGPPGPHEDIEELVARSARNRVAVKVHVDRMASWSSLRSRRPPSRSEDGVRIRRTGPLG